LRNRSRPSLAGLAALLLFAASCAGTLERASARYRQDRDYASLETITRSLRNGMSKTKVESLLGPPDSSPTDGQYNYSSSERSRILVVDYRLNDQLTDRLQHFELMTVGP
jgi:hypothetical protein